MGDKKAAEDPGRRDALKRIALGGSGVVALPILGQVMPTPAMARALRLRQGRAASSGSQAAWKPLFFDDHQNQTVIVLTELIIPETNTPGAKAALVNRYIDLVLNDEEPSKQKRFLEGLAWIEARSMMLHGKPFVELSAGQQTALLTPLADPENKNPDDRPGIEFFQEVKDLTIFGYYTSEIGMNRELEYGGDDYHTEFPGACTHPEHQS